MTVDGALDRYRQIVAAFAAGAVRGLDELGASPQRRTTQVSELFFTADTVYKLCRADNDAFNRAMFDFSDPAVRLDFVRQDFALNRYFSPSVYRALFGVRVRGTIVERLASPDDADELVLAMRRLAESDCLTSRLLAGRPPEALLHRAGEWLARHVHRYPIDPQLRAGSFRPLMRQRLADVAAFCELGRPHLAASTSNAILAWLARQADRLASELDAPDGGLVIGLDCHADNVYVEAGRLRLLDAFQIKPAWRLVDGLLNACRLGADIAVLGGEKLLLTLLDGYAPGRASALSAERLRLYLVYAALIRVVLWIDAGRLELANRYVQYIYAKMEGP